MAGAADCGDGRGAQGGRARDLHQADRPRARAAATYRSVCRRGRAKRRKSKAIATVATYIAGLCDHRDALVPGERGVLLCVALDQRVAKIILDYAEACFERSPILKQLIANRTADALELTNGITLPSTSPAGIRRPASHPMQRLPRSATCCTRSAIPVRSARQKTRRTSAATSA
jgi:hypothetical protein